MENIAEQVGGSVRNWQGWLSDSPWDDRGCLGEMQRLMGEQFGAPNGVPILDDTGFAKKGTHSAGVGRQYSGTLGRTDNCQIGVFMGYASTHGHTLVDCRLYLPRGWLEDPQKRSSARAAVPQEVVFQTKLELAAKMLREAGTRAYLPFQWVAGDAAYGDSHDLRQEVADLGRWYCFEVSRNTEVWSQDPSWEVPPPTGGRGRPRSRPRPALQSMPAQQVETIIQPCRKQTGSATA